MLAALLDDRLFVRTSDQKVFIVKSADDNLTSFALVDPVSLKDAGSRQRDDLTKIGTNNRLRRRSGSRSRASICRVPDASVRLAAVTRCCARSTTPSAALLQRARPRRDATPA